MTKPDTNTVYIPPFSIISKPKRDQPCNGCGWCCHEEICMIGKMLLKLVDDDQMIPHYIKGPCPLMDFVDGKVRCGAVIVEQKSGMEPKISEALGIGMGCCANEPREFL